MNMIQAIQKAQQYMEPVWGNVSGRQCVSVLNVDFIESKMHKGQKILRITYAQTRGLQRYKFCEFFAYEHSNPQVLEIVDTKMKDLCKVTGLDFDTALYKDLVGKKLIVDCEVKVVDYMKMRAITNVKGYEKIT